MMDYERLENKHNPAQDSPPLHFFPHFSQTQITAYSTNSFQDIVCPQRYDEEVDQLRENARAMDAWSAASFAAPPPGQPLAFFPIQQQQQQNILQQHQQQLQAFDGATCFGNSGQTVSGTGVTMATDVNTEQLPRLTKVAVENSMVISSFLASQVELRRYKVRAELAVVCDVVSTLLKEIEAQEPRFVSRVSIPALDQALINGTKLDSVAITGTRGFQVVLILSQMGVFNLVEEPQLPGLASLKLSDGRKRSMSLWVEFITASGYLSARKLRARLQTLLCQAVTSSGLQHRVTIQGSEGGRLLIDGQLTVNVVPGFHCCGIWPRAVQSWPRVASYDETQSSTSTARWPPPNVVRDVKNYGFFLLSLPHSPRQTMGCAKGTNKVLSDSTINNKSLDDESTLATSSATQSSSSSNSSNTNEADAWVMCFEDLQTRLLSCTAIDEASTGASTGPTSIYAPSTTLSAQAAALGRVQTLRALKTLRDAVGLRVSNAALTTLVLLVAETKTSPHEWSLACVVERLKQCLMLLTAALRNGRLPGYFLGVHNNTLVNLTTQEKRTATGLCWQLLRDITFRTSCINDVAV